MPLQHAQPPTNPIDLTPLEWAEKRPEVSEDTLALGFAFSPHPDGSAGPYNRKIARRMLHDLAPFTDRRPWVGVQWELADAARDLLRAGEPQGAASHGLARLIPEGRVIPPPAFTPRDVLDAGRVEDWLTGPGGRAGAWAVDILREHLRRTRRYLLPPPDDTEEARAAWLAGWLNGLLAEPSLWRELAATGLQLRDAIRVLRDGLAVVEQRRMPARDADLAGTYQLRRVNRLAIQGLCPEGLLRPMPYLSTQGVLDAVFDRLRAEGRVPGGVLVYGIPVHVERCARQLVRTAWQLGWPLDPRRVYLVLPEDGADDRWTPGRMADWQADPGNWVADTAQEWCRSLASWQAYNKEPAVSN